MPVGRLRSQPRRKEGGKSQMVFGLLCAADGCPVAVEVFPGNTADPTTLAAQVRKIRDRFGGPPGGPGGRPRHDHLGTHPHRSVTGRPGLDLGPAPRSTSAKLLKAPRSNPAGAPLRSPRHWSPDTVAENPQPRVSPANASWSASTRGCASNAPASARILLRATEATLAKIAAAARKHRPGPENRDRTPAVLSADRPTGIRWRKHFDLTVHR